MPPAAAFYAGEEGLFVSHSLFKAGISLYTGPSRSDVRIRSCMRTFQEEYRVMLELNDIKFDERYVWG